MTGQKIARNILPITTAGQPGAEGETTMHPLNRLFAAMDDNGDESCPPDISTMGKIEVLADFANRYVDFMSRPCPFKPGDFVTPRKDAPIRGMGGPHVVLETQAGALRWDDEAGSSGNGLRIDMRVAQRHRNGHFSVHWVESVHFEPWTEG